MSKQEFGDWQTPLSLAAAALALVQRQGAAAPRTVVEPTCGVGAFLVAAARLFPAAELRGYELNAEYVATASAQLPSSRARVTVADFFDLEWERELLACEGPLLIAGNPPWVTNAVQGLLGSSNLPSKRNIKGLTGYDARTGKSNFDVSEWMLLRLLGAVLGRPAMFAVLCKTAVARRVIEFASAKGWNLKPGGLWRIDAMKNFHAAVDAVLFVCETGALTRDKNPRWPVYASLDAEHPLSTMQISDGALIADADALARTAHLAGACEPVWRSGIKHDCSRVMELSQVDDGWINGLEERVLIEDELVFPMLKSSHVANGVAIPTRGVIVTQRTLGEDTASLKDRAPKAWSYLMQHADLLRARKSSIYREQPDFAIFGVGPYSFAPWKVAISGLYKRCEFTLVAPHHGRPVVLDDTCYFLPFENEADARRAHAALQSPIAQAFFAARIFWDAKRPISKAILQQLDLEALLVELELLPGHRKPRQQGLLFSA